MSQRRVVVTGLGLVTPLGVGVKTAWKNLLQGQCGIISLANVEGYEKLPVRIAGCVPQGPMDQGKFTASEWLDRGVKYISFTINTYFDTFKGRSYHGKIFSLCHCCCASSHFRLKLET